MWKHMILQGGYYLWRKKQIGWIRVQQPKMKSCRAIWSGMDIQRTVSGTQCYLDHATDLLLYRHAGHGGNTGRNLASGIQDLWRCDRFVCWFYHRCDAYQMGQGKTVWDLYRLCMGTNRTSFLCTGDEYDRKSNSLYLYFIHWSIPFVLLS